MKKILLLSFILLKSVCSVQAQEISISGKISDSEGVLSGVNVIIKGTTTGTVTDFDGLYTIDAPSDGILVFSYLGYKTTELAINGSTSINVLLEASAEQLTETIVVGSRGQARTKLKTTAPVDVINISAQSVNMPQLDLGQMLVASAPSFNAQQSQGGDLSSSVNQPSLRGLAPNQLLVLVNGKRRHTSAALIASQTGTAANSVDMSFILPEGIQSVSILRDGASAQYGSDAIAGVIDVTLKKGTDKFSGNFTVGAFPNSTPDLSDSGISDANQELLNDTQVDGLTYQLSGNYGISLKNDGYVNITGLYRQTERTERPNISNATPYGADYLNNQRTDAQGNVIITNPELIAAQAAGNTELAGQLTTDAGLAAARGLTSRDFSTFAGAAATNLAGVSYNMEIPLSENANLYSFGDFGFKNTEMYSCFYRRAAQDDRNNYDLYPNGFRPQMVNTQTNVGFTAGIDGEFGEWKYDFSNTFGKNNMKITQFNTINASLQSESPTNMNLGTHRFLQNTMNFDMTRYYDDVLAGLNVAFGAEFRVENYQIIAGQAESYARGEAGIFTATEDNQLLIGPDGFPLETIGSDPIVDDNGNALVLPFGGVSQFAVKGYSPNSQCFRGFGPENEADAFRSVTAFYVDFELDVTDKWLLSTAFRTENYSDFGGVFTGKVATRYSILDNVSLRGSFSSGFRAPSLQELNYSHTFTFFVDLEPFDGTLFPNNSSAARAMGIENLTEEKSTNISIGVAAKLFNKLELSIDAYQINIDDRIFSTGTFSSGDAPALAPVIGQGLASFRINGGDISTKGLEIVANYNDRVGDGMLGLMFSSVFRKNTFEGANVPDLNTTLSDEDLEARYIDRGVISQYETGTPNTTLIGSATYTIGKFSTNLRGTYFGEVTRLDDRLGTLSDPAFPNVGTNGYSDQTFSGQFVTDLGITYKATENLAFTVGGNNIFNNYPDFLRAEERGFLLYGNAQQGSNGSYYFARASFNF